jgi:hypothetical protein
MRGLRRSTWWMWLGLAVVACTPVTVPTIEAPTPPPAATALAAPSLSGSPVAAAASPAPAPTDQALPNPGGTCTAAQFTSGEAVLVGQPGAVMTEHVLVFEELRNAGPACVLAQPKIIGLAAGSGPFKAFAAPSLGQVVYVGNAGHYVYPASYPIRAGQSFRIDINAYWWFAPGPSAETRPPEFPCHDPIAAIDRAEIPLASGIFQIAWNQPFAEVCTTPPSVSIGFEFT